MIILIKTIEFIICVPKEGVKNRDDIIRFIRHSFSIAETTFQIKINTPEMSPSEVEAKLKQVVQNCSSLNSVVVVGTQCGRFFPIGSIIYWPYSESFGRNTAASNWKMGGIRPIQSGITFTNSAIGDQTVIVHEVGHNLGLGEHCEGEKDFRERCDGCLMHWTYAPVVSSFKQVPGNRATYLCPYCKAKLGGLIPFKEVEKQNNIQNNMARQNCPKCDSSKIHGDKTGTNWVCESCFNEWPIPPKTPMVDTSAFFQKTAEDAGKTEWGRGATEKPPSPPPASPPSSPPTQASTSGGGSTKKSEEPPEKSEWKQCPRCHRTIGFHEKVCPYCKGGSISGKIENKVKGKVTETGKTFTFNIFDAIKFSIVTALLIVVTTRFLVPELQKYFIFTLPGWFNVLFLEQGLWFIVGVTLITSLVLSIILGWTGKVSFQGIYHVELVFLAMEVIFLLSTNLFYPWYCGLFPDQCDYITCFVKYKSAEICAFGEPQVEVTKEGTWENLELKQGVYNGVSYPPAKPEGGSKLAYDYTFTLKNNNEVGTEYDINVTDIHVSASAKPDFDEAKYVRATSIITPKPMYTIKPGDPNVISATFNDNLPPCERYMYFKIKTATEQLGGGSVEARVTSEGLTKESFKPEIKTNPGPLDIYVRTVPILLEFDKLKDDGFKVFIDIVNKCTKLSDIKSGYGEIDKGLTLIWSDSLQINIESCVNSTIEETPCPKNQEGKKCVKITPNIGIYKTVMCEEGSQEDEVKSLRCDFKFTTNSFSGKQTGLISVISNYDYHYEFDESLGAICKGKEGSLPAEEKCKAGMNQECCNAEGYKWCKCDECDEQEEGCAVVCPVIS